ncbi:hypothetical protein B9T24_09955 [Acinetobacter sp. ANC 4654]|uniref:hypothetical protein n=1 Tax=Acinetobacter sp. ANC 4654 TaxID=1977872 RepID=UPI000A331EDB|nr:hypothetical protein [Acinetobacter sp. ANC 4654]OTG95068.1 hypothetical protein B9T24_09955 [Acinetobacter sp. ANC 4654]
MRKRSTYNEEDDDFNDWNDYKLVAQWHDTTQNMLSDKKWLYLGADTRSPNFTKVGITGGDLRSRSYSSANPTYYLFCAFQFLYNVSKKEMESVENDVLSRLDKYWCDESGRSMRLNHYESGVLSECFDNVNFWKFYKDLHYLIYTYHRNKFLISGYEAHEFDESNSEYVYCIFNKRLPKEEYKYIEMILQY